MPCVSPLTPIKLIETETKAPEETKTGTSIERKEQQVHKLKKKQLRQDWQLDPR